MPKQSRHSAATAAAQPKYDYDAFSRLVGPFVRLPKGKYKVQYRRLTTKGDAIKALSLVAVNLLFEVGFIVWLCASFLTSLNQFDATVNAGIIAIIIGIVIVEVLRLVNMITLSTSTLLAKDPVPVRPQRGTRLAFTTAIVPSKEPFPMFKKTLEAMKNVKHNGPYDVWLLDEGGVPAIRRACKKMGIKYFSRHGIEKWNTSSGRFKTKTKHGNYNAWLDEHGHDYDFVIGIDGDHVPRANFAQRALGYFRDPDVAFVVGPQVYGNYDNPITQGAESQAHIFQAAIQRGGNALDSAMFVGTNHAYRVAAWDTINGFQDSITEDMLTSMKALSTRNPKTGQFWKAVYTPDVLAVGEGPSSWTDFFSQQLRWSRGANEILLKNLFPLLLKLPWRAKLHYSLIITCYPTAALGWIIGIMVSLLYLVMGYSSPEISNSLWLALYVDVALAQFLLYGWLRKYNVSPHEQRGTLGFVGILFSMLSAPLYVTAFIATILRRKASFVVTPKGDSMSPDTWATFQKPLMWAGVIVAFLILNTIMGQSALGVRLWCLFPLTVCLLPVLQWQIGIWPETKVRLLRALRSMAPNRLIIRYKRGAQA